MHALVGYASAHGSTAQTADFIGRTLRENGLKATVANVEHVRSLADYDVIVLGSAVHSGKWLPAMANFVDRFAEPLSVKPVYLWLSCIRVLETHGLEHVMEYYLPQDTLNKLNLQAVTAFAGKLDLQNVDWNERWTLAARYDGTTWPSNFDGDFRDWEHIRAWSQQVAQNVAAKK